MVYDVSVTAGGITFTFQPGDVKSCKSSINANLEANELPSSGPMLSQLFDFNGSSKTITISGNLTDADSTRTTTGTITTCLEQKFFHLANDQDIKEYKLRMIK